MHLALTLVLLEDHAHVPRSSGPDGKGPQSNRTSPGPAGASLADPLGMFSRSHQARTAHSLVLRALCTTVGVESKVSHRRENADVRNVLADASGVCC